MQSYEYKAVAAPNRSKRYKGIKGNAARFAQVLSELMNQMAVDGWEYQRSDSLPVEEKAGLLKGRVETYHTLLIFRRPTSGPAVSTSEQNESPAQDVSLQTIVAPVGVPAPVAVEPFTAIAKTDGNEGYPDDPPLTATSTDGDEEDSLTDEPEKNGEAER